MRWTFTPHSPLPRATSERRGFEIRPFGALQRLVWANGAIEYADDWIAYWGHRFAVIADPRALRVLDAERAEVTRVSFDFEPRAVVVLGESICVESAEGVLWIPCADLESTEPRSEEVVIEDGYPQRVREATVEAKVAWLLAEDALVNVATVPIPTQIRIPHATFGLHKGMKITLADKLWPGRYAYIETPDRPRQVWFATTERRRTVTVTWTHEVARDPAAGSTTFIADARADALLSEGGDARSILIDLLGDAGEACAETFALLAAGKHVAAARRLEALGPLAYVLDDVEYRAGLPWSATIAKKPPTEAAVIDAAARDVRLAMIETLRRGSGPVGVYRKLIETRVLTGLRRVEAASVAALRALRGYSELVELWGVPSGKLALELLRGPAFAKLQRVELMFEDVKRLPALVDELAALPVREVTLVAPRRHLEPMIRAFAPRLAELGLDALAFRSGHTSLTIRDGAITASYADEAHVALLRSLTSSSPP